MSTGPLAPSNLPGDVAAMQDLDGLRTALIMAHPGHECRILGWTRRLRPRVSILTDGSGRAGTPRIARTAHILSDSGASQGRVFGLSSDRDVYESVLRRRTTYFCDVAKRLADDLIQHDVELTLGDSAEGEIMVHDLFREIRAAAVQIAETAMGRTIRHYEFPLESHPVATPPGLVSPALKLALSRADFRRKMAIARTYEQIAPFVDAALAKFGEEAFALECLFPFTKQSLVPDGDVDLPYEQHGRRQVELGHYSEAITRRGHLEPLTACLAELVAA
ncbi:MAG: hypothetical protein KDA61_16635 [Planctomycetales bacterium]|nr:hypothetical protein [Planctomycetales bacterium]